MALVGFPDKMQVTLGSAWKGTNGLSSGSTLVLTQKPINANKKNFSENSAAGVQPANIATNRLRLIHKHSAADGIVSLEGAFQNTTQGLHFADILSVVIYSLYPDYQFLDIYNEITTILPDALYSGFINGGANSYSPDIFSAMSAYVPVELIDVSEGVTPIPDGLSEARDFGSVVQSATPPTKTFTVENISGGTLNNIVLAVPSGYTVTEGLSSSLADTATDTFTVQLDTDTVGTFADDITITIDGDTANQYNFAVTGEVTAPVVSGATRLTSSNIKDGSLLDVNISSSAAITSTKVALADGLVLTGDASGQAAAVTMSGDVTIDNTGVATIGASVVDSSMLAGSVDVGKLTVTDGDIVVGNGSNVGAAVTLSGDATLDNAGALTLANSGVTADTYTNVTLTVNAKGLVTSASTGSSPDNFAENEVPSGTVNGTNDTFTLANTPVSGSEYLYKNGVRQSSGAGNDYTISSVTITFLSGNIPQTNDVLLVDYRY